MSVRDEFWTDGFRVQAGVVGLSYRVRVTSHGVAVDEIAVHQPGDERTAHLTGLLHRGWGETGRLGIVEDPHPQVLVVEMVDRGLTKDVRFDPQ